MALLANMLRKTHPLCCIISHGEFLRGTVCAHSLVIILKPKQLLAEVEQASISAETQSVIKQT